MQQDAGAEKVRESVAEKMALEMFGCTREQYRSLKERIREANGRVLVVVHPFYEHDHDMPQLKYGERRDNMAKVTKQLEELFANLPDSHAPVIVMQEKLHLPRRDLYLIGDPKQNIFFIPTERSDSKPTFEYKAGNNRKMTGGWDEALAIFHDLKVRKVTVSGMYLWNNSYEREGEVVKSYTGCVGAAYNKFKRDFDASLSKVTYPDGK